MSWFRPTIDYAPCPPYFVDNVYELFINETKRNNLTDDVVEVIRVKCSIEIPTTTTTTTSTTTTTTTPEPSTTSTTTYATQTTTEKIVTSTSKPIPTDSDNTTVTSSTTSSTKSVTEYNVTSVTPIETTIREQNTSSRTTITTESVPITSQYSIRTNLTSFSTTTTNENVTTENVTIATDVTNVPIYPLYSSGCTGICIIGIATGAVCLSLLLLLIVALTTLFRKGKESQKRSRSRSRNRFGDMPDVGVYDSVDIEDSPTSKRNSGSSLFRRSTDFSRATVVFDNPAYRRSFDLRPQRYNSWYDPDAADYDYSQINANLVTRKSRSHDKRSVSTSRLSDRHVAEHSGNARSRSFNASLHDYVPKVFNSSKDGAFSKHSPYYQQNGHIPNGIITNSHNLRTLPRTPIENTGKRKETDTRPKFKQSYRSRSFDPDLSGGSGHWEESQFMSMDNDRSRSRYVKNNRDKKNNLSRKDKIVIGADRRQQEIDIPCNRIYQTNSNNRKNQFQYEPPNCSNHTDRNSKIISSNLQPVSCIRIGSENLNGHYRGHSRSNGDRGAQLDDNCRGQSMSYRGTSFGVNERRHSNRHASYKPNNNELFMFQTKL